MPQRKNKPWRGKLFSYDKRYAENVLTIFRTIQSRLESMPCGPELSTLKDLWLTVLFPQLFVIMSSEKYSFVITFGLFVFVNHQRLCSELSCKLVHDFHSYDSAWNKVLLTRTTQSSIRWQFIFWVHFWRMVTWIYTIQRQQYAYDDAFCLGEKFLEDIWKHILIAFKASTN